MPALILINNKANEELARLIAADNPGCEVQVMPRHIMIECLGELRVARAHAIKAWAGTHVAEDPRRFERTWKNLFLGRLGAIAQWTDNEVVLSDGPAPQPKERALNIIISADVWDRLHWAVLSIPRGTKREIVEAALDEYLRARGR